MARWWRGTALWLLGTLLLLSACGGGIPATTTPSAATTTTPATSTTAAVASASPGAAVTRPASPVATPRGNASPSAAATPAARTAYPLTIQDIAGRRVTLAKRPDRIVSLAPSSTETLFALGLGARVVGVDQSSDYPAAARDKPKIGTFSQPTIEAVVVQSPDLVLAANLHVRSAVPALEARGLIVVVLNPADLPGVLDSISLVGQLADSAEAAQRLRGELEARIAAVEARLRGATARPRVYVEITPKFVAAGPASYIGDLIARAGGANIVDDRSTPYPPLSAEAIIARDPEVIILTDVGPEVTIASVGARPGWGDIGAVKTGRVAAIDTNLLNRAGPRVVDALEQLARICQPEAFR